MDRCDGMPNAPSRGRLARSCVTIMNTCDGASTQGTHFDVRSGSIGAAGGGAGESLSRRQQHFRDLSVDLQQHRPDVAQVPLDFTLTRLLHGPFARATGSNPVAAMATSIRSVVVVFSVLRRRNMAKFRGVPIFIFRGDAGTV